MMVTRYDPFADLLPLRDLVDSFFESPWPALSAAAPISAAPSFPFDLYDTGDDLVLRIAVPGADPSSIELTVNQGVLTLQGQRRSFEPEQARQYCWYARGIAGGEFRMSVALPMPVETDGAEASYEDGLLLIRLPKTAEARVKRIQISGVRQPEQITAGA
jgi:HSP20 family protein